MDAQCRASGLPCAMQSRRETSVEQDCLDGNSRLNGADCARHAMTGSRARRRCSALWKVRHSTRNSKAADTGESLAVRIGLMDSFIAFGLAAQALTG